MSKIEYKSKEVELSRVYPFGETRKINSDKKETEITVITVNELNGEDEETIYKKVEEGKLTGLVEISVATGLDYDEVKKLARKDIETILRALAGF